MLSVLTLLKHKISFVISIFIIVTIIINTAIATITIIPKYNHVFSIELTDVLQILLWVWLGKYLGKVITNDKSWDFYFVGCNTLQSCGRKPAFQRNNLLPPSGLESGRSGMRATFLRYVSKLYQPRRPLKNHTTPLHTTGKETQKLCDWTRPGKAHSSVSTGILNKSLAEVAAEANLYLSVLQFMTPPAPNANTSHYITSKGRMISESWRVKDLEGSGRPHQEKNPRSSCL
jgi:hypothetical protein